MRILQEDEPRFFYTRDWFKGRGFDIGEFTYGNPRIMHWGENATLKIGKFCSIADEVTIFLGGNHRVDWVSTYPFNFFKDEFPKAADIKGHPATKGDVIIENDVWIGRGVSILSGVHIGSGAVIAAESVITKSVGPYEIVGGNPACLIRKRFSQETIDKLLEINWWDWKPEDINKTVERLCCNEIEDFVNGFYNEDKNI